MNHFRAFDRLLDTLDEPLTETIIKTFHRILKTNTSDADLPYFRVGRLLLFRECLRHGIVPFIIDDKRRTGYLDGIRCWDDDPDVLMDVCIEAQMRFEAQIALQGLLECQSWHMRAYRKGGNR